MGHGTNVAGLETTATFDKSTDEFVIHTPSISAIKWWPGEMGGISNYAIAYADLIIDSKHYGICPFLV
jgi:acyl-CoA oxidase